MDIKMKYLTITIVFMLFYGCQQQVSSVEVWKKEIHETEKAFAQMVKDEGIHDAFLAFADEEAVLLRGNKLIIGKDSINTYLEGQVSKSLLWTPDFIDVSVSGDLGYTYGKYSFSYLDSEGVEKTNEGFFHTVWKRQADGTWKFVWD